VRMDDVGIPRSEHRSDAPCGGQVPVAAHAYGCCRNAGGPKPSNEWSVGCGDHERLVTLLTLPACEEVDLSLSTAPFSAGVQVQDAKRDRGSHAGRMDAVGPHRNTGQLALRIDPGCQLIRPNVCRSRGPVASTPGPRVPHEIHPILRTTRTIPSSEGKGV
jgi:hypothetical protein